MTPEGWEGRGPLRCHASGMEGGARLAFEHRDRGMGLEGAVGVVASHS